MLDIESDSDDEQELGGGELIEHLQYFYDVYKNQENNANKIRKISGEYQATHEEQKDDGIKREDSNAGTKGKFGTYVKEGFVKVAAGAVGIDPISQLNNGKTNIGSADNQ